MILIAIAGVLGGILCYSGVTASYKKAGAGTTYRIESSTDVRLNRKTDNRSGSRSHVDHGFYSGNVSASGRSEAYRMPQSIKQTIAQAVKEVARQELSEKSDLNKPGSRPRPPFGPMNSQGQNGRKGR